jgi:hypothetical protein
MKHGVRFHHYFVMTSQTALILAGIVLIVLICAMVVLAVRRKRVASPGAPRDRERDRPVVPQFPPPGTTPPHGEPSDDEPLIEHLDATAFAYFVPPGVFPRLRNQVGRWSQQGEAQEHRRRLEVLERQIETVDWLAQLARRAVAADTNARALIRDWVASEPPAEMPAHDDTHGHDEPDTPEGRHGHGGASDDAVPFLLDRVFEAAMGIVYAGGSDDAARARGLAALGALLQRCVPTLDRLYAAILPGKHGVQPLAGLWHLLRGVDGETGSLGPLSQCHCVREIEAMLHALAHLPANVQQDLGLRQDPGELTPRIHEIGPGGEPHTVCLRSKGTPFPPAAPRDYRVFFEPGLAGNIVQWSAAEIEVAVPAGAQPGAVWLGTEAHPRRGLAAAAKLAGSLSPREHIPLFLADVVQPSLMLPDRRNRVELAVAPAIVRLSLADVRGRELGTGAAPDSRPLILHWDVDTDHAGDTRITISNGNEQREVGRAGSMELQPGDEGRYTIIATGIAGSITGSIDLFRRRRLIAEPPFVCIPPNATRRVEIYTGNPEQGSAGLTVMTDDEGAVVTLIPDHPPAFPAFRASVDVDGAIVVEAAGHDSATVQVFGMHEGGVWTNGPDLETAAVHMAMLRTGKVLIFNADPDHFNDMNHGKTFLWDVATNGFRELDFGYDDHKNLFCSGHCMLADGRALVIGGHTYMHHGSTGHEVHTFDPATERWSKHPRMRNWRWYPTVVPMRDRRALIVSGSEGYGGRSQWGVLGGLNHHVEIFDPSSAAAPEFFPEAFPHREWQSLYPHLFPLPGDQLFVHLWDVTKIYAPSTPPWSVVAEIPSALHVLRSDPGYVTAVMLPLASNERRHVRFFIAGGIAARAMHEITHDTQASNIAEVLELDTQNVGAAAWRMLPEPLPQRRFMSDGVLLADGTVLIVNGAARGQHTSAQEPVLHPVIYDPRSTTRSFREMSPTTQQRLYHGSALLLPDGRVVVGGHTKAFNDRLPVENGRLELFSPPYLFRGPRPVILSAPVRVRHSQTFEVVTRAEDEIAEVTFVRMSTVTHQLNTDQRCFFLREIDYARVDDERRTLTVEAPVEPTLAPPGYYMLFLISARTAGRCGGAPSIAAIVQLEP